MRETLIIIPTYNEKQNVAKMSAAIREAAPFADLLFVDDNSPDGTGELLDGLAGDEAVHVLHRPGKDGLGRAYLAGFRWALEQPYRFIFEMDADFSHNPLDIPRLREAAGTADLVLGSRYVDGAIRVVNWPLGRLLLSRGAATYVKLITGMPVSDPTGGFRCYRREVLEAVDLDTIQSNGYSFQVEMAHRAWRMGFLLKEIPITFEERRSGESKMSARIVREALWVVWRLRFRSGARASGRPHPRSVGGGKEPTP